ncbi:MAG: hypothetical protein O3A53_04655 [Acidobacteria bacterium]|nr:hypothetical protein [Acidobacteriota bacterium]MDA1234071.1 hypothetical protein [Acidobacteriota bacterium]
MYRLYSTVLCAVAMLGTFTTACDADVKEEFSQTVALNAGGEFDISNVNGQVEIATWNRNEVRILATKLAKNESVLKDVQVVVTGSGEKVEVDTKLPKGWNRSGSVSYRITLPASVKLDARTVNGSVSVDGVSGRMDLHSVNGRVEASGAVAPVTAKTVNSQLRIRYADKPKSGEHTFETVNGSVRVYLPASVAGRFHAGSVNGSIEADFPLQVTKAGFGPSRSLDGELGNGGDANFSFKTVNGSIDIRSSETTASNSR